MEYKTIKTRGKKLRLFVDRDGTVVVKVPARCTKKRIDAFVAANIRWIEQQRSYHRQKAVYGNAPDSARIKQLKIQAQDVMTEKTELFSAVIGVKPDRIKITSAKKRWGSCIRKGKGHFTICYSYRNMFLSDRCRDYIVVHELCHMKHMNHSPAFYAAVAEVLPDYKDIEKEIKRYGDYDLYPVSLK